MMRCGGGCDSSHSSCSSEDDIDVGDGPSSPIRSQGPGPSRALRPAPSTDTVVIHLDVDAFYCQCEELRNPDLATEPFAIGQKHIVVTCNYVARSRGVKKLMLRSKAKEMCPGLVIVEGSDLEPYRRQARRIYNSFRKAVASLPGGNDNLAKKGGMDEMYADISAAVRLRNQESSDGNALAVDEDVFLYGQDRSSAAISISEDQSGATAHVLKSHLWNPTQNQEWSNEAKRDACVKQLLLAAKFASQIRRQVRIESGFRACVGVSTSPMLAKLASELRKPNSLNILQPWRAPEIIIEMPLRKIPGLGSRTLKSLEASLAEHNTPRETYWTCSDLLRVPRSTVAASCGEEHCDILLKRCRGIDPLQIVDDNGGLAKTVSVEDSYKRGSVTTISGVLDAMNGLYKRLPRLLDDRRLDSGRPDLSYPSTIRFTVRLVDESVSHRRPFVTKSKQSTFDGRNLMVCGKNEDRSSLLRAAVRPLLDKVLLGNMDLNVTRLNIAVTCFADMNDMNMKTSPFEPRQRSVEQFFLADKLPNKASQHSKLVCEKQNKQNAGEKRNHSQTADAIFQKSSAQQKHKKLQKSLLTVSSEGIAAQRECQVDPSFLAALPADIRVEVEREIKQQIASISTMNMKKISKKKAAVKIDSFFSRK